METLLQKNDVLFLAQQTNNNDHHINNSDIAAGTMLQQQDEKDTDNETEVLEDRQQRTTHKDDEEEEGEEEEDEKFYDALTSIDPLPEKTPTQPPLHRTSVSSNGDKRHRGTCGSISSTSSISLSPSSSSPIIVDVEEGAMEGDAELLQQALPLPLSLVQPIQLISDQLTTLLIENWSDLTSAPELFDGQELLLAALKDLIVTEDGEIHKGVCVLFLQFFLRRITSYILRKRSEQDAIWFLTLVDLMVITPLNRFVTKYKNIPNPMVAASRSPSLSSVQENVNQSGLSESSDEDMLKLKAKNRATPAPATTVPTRASASVSAPVPGGGNTNTTSIFDDLEENLLPSHLVQERKNVYKASEQLLQDFISHIHTEYHIFNDADSIHIINVINVHIQHHYTGPGRTPIRLNANGIVKFGKALAQTIHVLAAPAVKIASRFLLRTELPKFLRGFLVKVNDNIVVYNKFLRRRYSLFPQLPSNKEDTEIDLFLCSELQRNHELHPGLSLTEDISEVMKERAFLTSLMEKFKRNLFPKGLLHAVLIACFPVYFVEKLDSWCQLMEPYVDTFLFENSAEKVRKDLNEICSPDYINSTIVTHLRMAFPYVYEAVMQNELQEAEYRVQAEFMLRRLTESLLEENSHNVTGIVERLKQPWYWALGLNNLIVDGVIELLDLFQRPIFVKNLVYNTLDFIANQLECNAYRGIHIAEFSKSRRPEIIQNFIPANMTNIFDLKITEDDEILKEFFVDDLSTNEKGENFRSVFEYLKGNFATQLATNMIHLITFKQRQRWVARSAWSAAAAAKLLEISSALYGVGDVVGVLLMNSLEELMDGYTKIRSMEEFTLKLFQKGSAFLKSEEESCNQINEILDRVELSFSDEELEEISVRSSSTEQKLEWLLESITDWEAKVSMGKIIAANVQEDKLRGSHTYVGFLWNRIERRLQAIRRKRGIFARLSKLNLGISPARPLN